MNKVFALFTFFIFSFSSAQETIILYPSYDARCEAGYVATMQLLRDSSTANSPCTDDTLLSVRTLRNGSGYYAHRSYLTFDTSVLPSNAVVKSASLFIRGVSTNYFNNSGTSLSLVKANNISNPILTGEYGNVNFLPVAPSKPFSSLSQSGFNEFKFSDSHLSGISTTGLSSYAFMTELDRSVGSMTLGHDNQFMFRSVDFSGTTSDPYLVIQYDLISEQADDFNTAFGIALIIVILSVMFITFMYNQMKPKKPWQK